MLDRRTLPLSALRAFECTGRHLNMGRAGEELGVTHGAISHQVRALESQLGTPLFIRANNRLQLTDSGQRLLRAVIEGFERILDGTQHLDPDSLSGSLVIGCTQTAGASWVARNVSDFHDQYPQIEIRIVEIKPQQEEIPGDIDIAICYGRPEAQGRRVEELIRAQIFPVCSPRILHDKVPVTQPEHLVAYALLFDSQNSWSRWFSDMDVAVPDDIRQIHFFSTNLALNAARFGCGIALCNRLEVQEDLREGRLIQLLDRTIPESHGYYVLADNLDRQSLRARLFEEWVKNGFR
jgi:LysR family glycine cleavage system transcriptional activator